MMWDKEKTDAGPWIIEKIDAATAFLKNQFRLLENHTDLLHNYKIMFYCRLPAFFIKYLRWRFCVFGQHRWGLTRWTLSLTGDCIATLLGDRLIGYIVVLCGPSKKNDNCIARL